MLHHCMQPHIAVMGTVIIIALVHVIVSFRCSGLALQSPFLSPSVSQTSENGCSLYRNKDPLGNCNGRRRLGELGSSIASRFCCGSTLSSPEQVNLVYQSGDGFPSLLFSWCRANSHATANECLFCCQFLRRVQRSDGLELPQCSQTRSRPIPYFLPTQRYSDLG